MTNTAPHARGTIVEFPDNQNRTMSGTVFGFDTLTGCYVVTVGDRGRIVIVDRTPDVQWVEVADQGRQ